MDPHDKSTVLSASGAEAGTERVDRGADSATRLPHPGDVLEGRYCVEGPIGSGGMAFVFCARHTTIGTRVAIKSLAPRLADSEEHVERFLQEARAISVIEHPCIVRITDFGHTAAGDPFFAMEYLDGEDLGRRLRRTGPLPWEAVGPFAVQICGALHAAHTAGIIHRDIKPANIFVVEGTDDIKVLDFGIAKISTVPHGRELTRVGSVMGTAGFLSPEALSGKDVDPRTDIYSLGVTLYQLVSGALPFDHENGDALSSGRHPRIAHPLPDYVPSAVGDIIHKCMAHQPQDRFPNVLALFEAIVAVLPSQGEAALPTLCALSRARVPHGSLPDPRTLVPCDPLPRRSRGPWLATLAVVLVGALVMALRPRYSTTIDPGYLASFGSLPDLMHAPDQPLDKEKISLGRLLFFDPQLSKSGEISCAVCHPLERYGADGRAQATGHAHMTIGRNAPTVYNAAGQFAQGWSGSSSSVEEQVHRPLLDPHEMANTRAELLRMLEQDPEYPALFAEAFPDRQEPLSMETLSVAIGAFERTLVTPSRWDRFLEGDPEALTDIERRGFNAFVEIGCVQCHSGTYVGGSQMQKLGLLQPWPDSRDRGRYEETGKDTDWMLFKVPGLRNVTQTAPYFHDGSVATLETAVRRMARHQLDRSLSDEEVEDIVAFLDALTGELPRFTG